MRTFPAQLHFTFVHSCSHWQSSGTSSQIGRRRFDHRCKNRLCARRSPYASFCCKSFAQTQTEYANHHRCLLPFTHTCGQMGRPTLLIGILTVRPILRRKAFPRCSNSSAQRDANLHVRFLWGMWEIDTNFALRNEWSSYRPARGLSHAVACSRECQNLLVVTYSITYEQTKNLKRNTGESCLNF